MWWTDASRPYGDDRRYSKNIRIININNRDVKRGQMLEAEVEAKARTSRPRSRPRPNTWGRGRGRGHNLEAEVEAEAKFNRPSPGPKLKRPNRTLYITMKIYAIKHCAIINAIISLIIVNAFWKVSPNIYSEVYISSSLGLIVCITFKKTRHSSTAFGMCARCEDMVSPLWEKTLYWSRTGWHTEQTLK